MNSATAEQVTVIRSKALYLSLVLIFLSACSDPTIEFGNLVERGGVYYEKFSTEPFSGRVTGLRVGNLVDGRFDGQVHEFDSQGQLKNEINFSRGLRHGIHRRYKTDGSLGRVAEYKEGRLLLYKSFYDDADHTLESLTRVDSGVHQSSYFHKNGNLRFEVSVRGYQISKNPILSTSVIEFDSEGQQVAVYPLSNNKIHGLVRWTVGEFAGCAYEFTNGVVYPPGDENRHGRFIPDDEVEQRLTEMEEFYTEPCFEAVRRIPCPLCYLNNHSDQSG